MITEAHISGSTIFAYSQDRMFAILIEDFQNWVDLNNLRPELQTMATWLEINDLIFHIKNYLNDNSYHDRNPGEVFETCRQCEEY